MGFATILGAIAFLFLFAGMAAFAVHSQKMLAQSAQEQARATELERRQTGMQLHIESATYALRPVVGWIDDAYGDFAQGTRSNTQLVSPGSVELSGPSYPASGTYTSQAIDTGFAGTNYTTLSWTSVTPVTTYVSYQVRAASTTVALAAAPFGGPDGTAATYYTVSGGFLNGTVVNGSRYFQYRATLSSNNSGVTPELESVTVGVVRNTGVITVTVTNSGTEKLTLNATDVYVDGLRVIRNVTARTFNESALTDHVLWMPGETLDVNVFGVQTPPVPLTVANGPAHAGATVY